MAKTGGDYRVALAAHRRPGAAERRFKVAILQNIRANTRRAPLDQHDIIDIDIASATQKNNEIGGLLAHVG